MDQVPNGSSIPSNEGGLAGPSWRRLRFPARGRYPPARPEVEHEAARRPPDEHSTPKRSFCPADERDGRRFDTADWLDSPRQRPEPLRSRLASTAGQFATRLTSSSRRARGPAACPRPGLRVSQDKPAHMAVDRLPPLDAIALAAERVGPFLEPSSAISTLTEHRATRPPPKVTVAEEQRPDAEVGPQLVVSTRADGPEAERNRPRTSRAASAGAPRCCVRGPLRSRP